MVAGKWTAAEAIARRLRLPVARLRATLDEMVDRGQIGSFTMAGVQRYALMPFVIGIYEFQLSRLDGELAGLFEEYAPHLLQTVGGHEPALARVVPVHASIDSRLSILGYEDLRTLIDQARSFALRECICRKERALQGHPCSHSLETCLAFSHEERERFGLLGLMPPHVRAIEEQVAHLDLLRRHYRTGRVSSAESGAGLFVESLGD